MAKPSELAERIQESADGIGIIRQVRDMREQVKMALPRHQDADRFVRMALTELRLKPELAACTPASILGGLMVAAQLGLDIGPLGHIYLIPFKNRRAGTTEATVIIGYKGEMELAYRSGLVSTITARCVYEGEVFKYQYGSDERIEHIPMLTGRGDLKAVYAIATMSDGGQIPVVLSVDDVEYYRKRSKTPDRGPWKTDYEAMARKTAVRRLATWLPTTAETAVAHVIDGHVIRETPEELIDAAALVQGDDAVTVVEGEEVKEGEAKTEPLVEGNPEKIEGGEPFE